MPHETPPTLITPFCTVAWGNAFFASYVFDANWTDASSEKKASALNAATDFINLYCSFLDANGNPVTFTPDGTEDYDDEVIPRLLKQACAQEGAYLLSLDDNPAEPHPLTILGLLRGDFGIVDPELVPPIFPRQVVKLLTSLGGVVDATATGPQNFGFQEKLTTQ